MQRFIFILILNFLNFVSYSQEAGWFVGTWKAGALTRKRATTQNIQTTFTITNVSGNSFEGIVQVRVSATDTSVHLDSKVSGTISHNYLSAKLGEIIYKKDPPGGRWETKCNTCGPIQFVYSINEGRFILTGETKDCLRPCNGISIYSRDSSDFDSTAWASLRFLVTGEQTIAKQTPATVDTTSIAKDDGMQTEIVKLKSLPVVLQKVKSENQNTRDIQLPDNLLHARSSMAQFLIEQPLVKIDGPPIVLQPVKRALPTQNKPRINSYKHPLLIVKSIQPATKPPVIKVAVNTAPVKPAADTSLSKPVVKNTTPVATNNTVVKDSAFVKKPTVVLEQRITNLVKTFPVTTDSVLLRVFDNGAIDGDTVSVLYNDVVVVNRLGLTARAYEIKIPVNKTGDNKVVLYAHNLGEIPPNSALLEIYSGKKMYSLTVTSDLKTSSGISLTYQKE